MNDAQPMQPGGFVYFCRRVLMWPGELGIRSTTNDKLRSAASENDNNKNPRKRDLPWRGSQMKGVIANTGRAIRRFCTLRVMAGMVAAGVVHPVLAEDRTWFGGTGDWGIASNWSPARVPDSGDNAVIRDGNIMLLTDSGVGRLEFNAGEIGGKGNLYVSGAAFWGGGTFSGTGTTDFAGPLSISGWLTKSIDSGRVINVTDTTWGGNFRPNFNGIQLGFGGSAGSIIRSAGTWSDTNAFDSYIMADFTDVSSAFDNRGTYNKQGNALTMIGAAYNNTGTTNVNAGTMALGGGGTSTGVFNVAANSTLNFTGGTHNLNKVTTSGAGTIDIGGNSIVNVYGGEHGTDLVISQDGRLQGASHTFNGPATWMGGSIRGQGITDFDGGLSITGNSYKTIEGGRIIYVADTTWGGNTRPHSNQIFALSNSVNPLDNAQTIIINSGTWNDTNAFDSDMGGGNFSFYNEDTYNKQGNAVTIIGANYRNTGTTNVDAGTLIIHGTFLNSGTTSVNSASTFRVADLILCAASGGCENKTWFYNDATGRLQGSGTVITPEAGLTNSGKINPGDGIGLLTIHGDLIQGVAGALNIELAGLNSFDQLTVTDDVTFGGILAISNEGYTPAIGDRFVVATFDERLAGSTFSSVALNGFGPEMNFDVIYNEHDVTLAVTAVPTMPHAAATAVPEPEGWAMLLAGLALVGHMAVRWKFVHLDNPARSSTL